MVSDFCDRRVTLAFMEAEMEGDKSGVRETSQEMDVIIQVKNDTIWPKAGAVGRKSIFFITGHTHPPA